MNTRPDNHRVGQEARMGHVGADGLSALFGHTGRVPLHRNAPRSGAHVGAIRESPVFDSQRRGM